MHHLHQITSQLLPPSATTINQATTGARAIMAHQEFDDGLLDCTVSNPQKEGEGTQSAYISYTVTTKTNFKTFQKPKTVVRRRFTDFVFLYNTLSREYPAVAVPPLPQKHNMAYVRGARFSEEFTQRRAHSLNRFLRRTTLHPELRRAAVLLQFLESPEWHSTMKARMPGGRNGGSPEAAAATAPVGVLETWTDTFLNAFSKVHKPDKRFIEVREKADKLADDLGTVEKAVARVARRQGDLAADYEEVATQFAKLQVLEPGVGGALTSFSASVHESADGWTQLRNHTDRNYLGSLRDMDAYISAMKALLKAREQKQLDFEALSDYLAKAAADRDQLASHHGATGGVGGIITRKIEDVRGVDHEQARRDRKRKLEIEIERLTGEVEGSKVTSEMFDDRTVHEVQEFERIKAIELQDTLGGLADAHIDFFSKTMETWERFVKDMEKEGITTS